MFLISGQFPLPYKTYSSIRSPYTQRVPSPVPRHQHVFDVEDAETYIDVDPRMFRRSLGRKLSKYSVQKPRYFREPESRISLRRPKMPKRGTTEDIVLPQYAKNALRMVSEKLAEKNITIDENTIKQFVQLLRQAPAKKSIDLSELVPKRLLQYLKKLEEPEETVIPEPESTPVVEEPVAEPEVPEVPESEPEIAPEVEPEPKQEETTEPAIEFSAETEAETESTDSTIPPEFLRRVQKRTRRSFIPDEEPREIRRGRRQHRRIPVERIHKREAKKEQQPEVSTETIAQPVAFDAETEVKTEEAPKTEEKVENSETKTESNFVPPRRSAFDNLRIFM